MTAEILVIALRAAGAASVAIALVLLLRPLTRRAFGSIATYRLWLLVPIAGLASQLPAREIEITANIPDRAAPTQAAADAGAVLREASASLPTHLFDSVSSMFPAAAPLVAALWIGGAIVSLFFLFRQHARQMAGVHNGRAQFGPAAIGLVAPRIILPEDFETRFDSTERNLVLAHERSHIESGDLVVNAAAAVLACLNWYNPLFGFARKQLRADQELACDERILSTRPTARGPYARAMLKAQLGPDLALGCAWPRLDASTMRTRLTLLMQEPRSQLNRVLGALTMLAISSAAALTAWSAQPPRAVASPMAETNGAGPTSLASDALGQALLEALLQRDFRRARDLIAAGANPNFTARRDGSPLILAARSHAHAIAEQLIAAGANPNLSMVGDGSPLTVASAEGDARMVRLLLDAGADVDLVSPTDDTPLINAARSGDRTTVELLLAAGADPNLRATEETPFGTRTRTPLSEALRQRHFAIANVLRQHGARE